MTPWLRERVLQCKREIQHYGDHPCCLEACEADKALEQFARDVAARCCDIIDQRYTSLNPQHTIDYTSGYQGACYDIKQAIRREALGDFQD
mgnify:CR=1 FL=1